MNLYYISFRGLVRLKKVHKSEKNSDWPDYPQPTHYLFFWKHVQNTHQPTFEFLWEFLTFFNLPTSLQIYVLSSGSASCTDQR